MKDSADSSDANLGEDNFNRGSSSSGRRTILPYGGAKSDGLLNKHAFISCNVIAAAERRKRDSYSRSSTTELPLEKVIEHLVDHLFLSALLLSFCSYIIATTHIVCACLKTIA